MARALMFGHGYGHGCGDGDGYGGGYGGGYGFGFGGGYGGGGGEPAGYIAGYTALALTPWPVVKVGCETHSIAEWAERYEEIARDHEVEVGDREARKLLASARRLTKGEPR